MRSVVAGFTTRGRAFLAAGVAAAVLGLGLGQPVLLSIGALLICLPVLAAATTGRGRWRVRCQRVVSPARVPAGEPAGVAIRVDNVSRLPTGLLLAEDTVPYALGVRPRFVLDRIAPGGYRELSYQLRADHRGRYPIGPLEIRVGDVFGLVRLSSAAAGPGSLIVTPPITALPRTALAGAWLGSGGSRAAIAAAAGDDDVVPRPYRDGDELRRVHWRSTARYGELMVRREEQHWRNRALLFLDTRACAHSGRGAVSSFEAAVGAAASIGTLLAREGIDGQFLTDSGPVIAPGSFEDALLDTLAVIAPSRNTDLRPGLAQIPREEAGLLFVVAGALATAQAEQLAAARHGSQAMALLLATSTWSPDRPPGPGPDAAADILTRSGWRVAVLTAATPLASAWSRLIRPASAGRIGTGHGPAAGPGAAA